MGKPPQARHPFVMRVVGAEILGHHVLAALAAAEEAGEVDAHVVAEPFADDQGVPVGADRLLDQGGGGEPEGVVEGGLVERRQAALEGVVRVHASPRRRGPACECRNPAC